MEQVVNAGELNVGDRVRRTAQAYKGAPYGIVVEMGESADGIPAAKVRMDDGEWWGTGTAWTRSGHAIGARVAEGDWATAQQGIVIQHAASGEEFVRMDDGSVRIAAAWAWVAVQDANDTDHECLGPNECARCMVVPDGPSGTVADMVARGKEQIREDVGNGAVPNTVGSFSQLHDYVDANMYGLADDDDVTLASEMAEVQDALHAWIIAGGVRDIASPSDPTTIAFDDISIGDTVEWTEHNRMDPAYGRRIVGKVTSILPDPDGHLTARAQSEEINSMGFPRSAYLTRFSAETSFTRDSATGRIIHPHAF